MLKNVLTPIDSPYLYTPPIVIKLDKKTNKVLVMSTHQIGQEILDDVQYSE
jgi:hypothetical protein